MNLKELEPFTPEEEKRLALRLWVDREIKAFATKLQNVLDKDIYGTIRFELTFMQGKVHVGRVLIPPGAELNFKIDEGKSELEKRIKEDIAQGRVYPNNSDMNELGNIGDRIMEEICLKMLKFGKYKTKIP